MYFDSKNKTECFGCEACVQVCGVSAITMTEDNEGFRYPRINSDLCVNCNKCRKVCPNENVPGFYQDEKYTFGGYNKDADIRFESTSGGAFSAIVEAFCDENYVIFGAESNGLDVFHSCILDKKELSRFRKSKYSQSVIGDSYKLSKQYLQEGRKVLFSGTPCQIAGLKAFLGNVNQNNLLTVEVICEGVPSPLYIRKYDVFCKSKYKAGIADLDYRFTGKSFLSNGKWDFQQMKTTIDNNDKQVIVQDRWFNPYWSIWLKHLMSRPSCYKCTFAKQERLADISLGDLWGVHLYCPELYGKNKGSSLIICNSTKGKAVLDKAKANLYGHELEFQTALKYQGPMRNHISENPDRCKFMSDLQSEMSYKELNKKWATQPSLKLLFYKYLWGNRQKIWFWNMTHSLVSKQKD